MADDASAPAKSSNGGILPIVIVTVLGVGLGVGFKQFVMTDDPPAKTAAATDKKKSAKSSSGKEKEAGKAKKGDDGAGDQPDDPMQKLVIVDLPPVVSNLKEANGVWLRLEAALMFSSKPEQGYSVVAQQTGADILAYIRTVPVAQIENGQGLEYLSDDLLDIARIRSKGAVQRLVIKTLVVE